MNALDRIEAAFFDGDWEWLDDNVKYDTIAALVAVAEAADTFIVCNEGGEPISWLGLKAALAPLVKEESDDRA